MTRICLDTSAYSNFRRGEAAAVDAIRRAKWVGLSTVVLGELRTGFQLGSRADVNEAELRAFLAEPVVEILDIDDETSRHYADIVVALRKAGTPIPTNDVWIAASGARHGAQVVTFDEHFRRIERVATIVLERHRTPLRTARRASTRARGATTSKLRDRRRDR